MKTIEEKAKAYDEIIERAKTMLSAGEVMYGKENNASQLITDLIPELRESEDERMMWEFNDWLCEEIECRTNDLRDEKDHRTLNMLCYVLTKVKEWLEKQKESLHISESCKENADSFTSEDERIRKDLIYDIERLPMQGVLTHRPTSEYIAYLEKQEQKPAWSEEDEKDVAHIIRILDDCYAYGRHDLSKTDHENLVNKLKYLRPSWKPSEEQIAELKALANGKAVFTKDFIVKLYNDLLKLK